MTVGQEKYTIPKPHDPQTREGDDFDDERDYNSCSVIDFNVDRVAKNAFGGHWDKGRCVVTMTIVTTMMIIVMMMVMVMMMMTTLMMMMMMIDDDIDKGTL